MNAAVIAVVNKLKRVIESGGVVTMGQLDDVIKAADEAPAASPSAPAVAPVAASEPVDQGSSQAAHAVGAMTRDDFDYGPVT